MSSPAAANITQQQRPSLLRNGRDSTLSMESDQRMSMENVNQGGSSRSLGSSLTGTSTRSLRSARVRRTIRRQKQANVGAAFSFTSVLVESLADVAQAFLYPDTTTASNNKENTRRNIYNSKNAVNTSVETAETSSEALDDEEETFTTLETGRSLDTRTPPPNLAALAPASSVKRPIPVASPGSSFDPVFPSSFGGAATPIARVRAPVPEQAPPRQEASYDEQSRNSENFVADKHRKWRRQIKLQKKRLAQRQDDDDTSLLTTCEAPSEDGPKTSKSSSGRQHHQKLQEPVHILAQLMRAPCADVEDVIANCEEGAVSSDNEEDLNNLLIDPSYDDDDSSHYDTSVTESEGTAERRSDFTGGTESTISSFARRQSPSSTGSARSSSIAQSSTSALRGVLKASSFGNSSVASPPCSEVVQPRDKNFIKSFIEEMTRDGTLLIWHGPQGDSTAFRRPCGVIAHLKLGAPMDGIYSGPQLVWQKQDGSDGGAVDLFDIQSMDTVSINRLESYQFAIPENTFFVVLNNGKHVVFEASSDTDAKRFIHGLRWVVARLSFNLVVGNPLVSCELLSVGGSESPQTPTEEALWSKAMNDVTNHLVDKSLTQVAAQEE